MNHGKKTVLALLAALLFPGALLLALPDSGPDRSRWLQTLPEFAEPGLLYSGPASFSLPLVVPLESAIGRRHLGESLEIKRDRFRLGLGAVPGEAETFLTAAPYLGFARPGLRADFLSLQLSYFARRFNLHGSLAYAHNRPFDEFDPGDRIRAELFAGYAPEPARDDSFRPPVNLLVGLTADYHYADVYQGEELATSEFGTVFLAPGLQLAGRRMLFEATVELPLRRTAHIPHRYRDRVRTNIGMKYFLR